MRGTIKYRKLSKIITEIAKSIKIPKLITYFSPHNVKCQKSPRKLNPKHTANDS